MRTHDQSSLKYKEETELDSYARPASESANPAPKDGSALCAGHPGSGVLFACHLLFFLLNVFCRIPTIQEGGARFNRSGASPQFRGKNA